MHDEYDEDIYPTEFMQRVSNRKEMLKVGHFYIGEIRQLTPDRIIKIGVGWNDRIREHERRWGKKWNLIGIWRMRDPFYLESSIRLIYREYSLSTGLDFFYLDDHQINLICWNAISRHLDYEGVL